MENSKISWTHHTFNPWRGCTKVSSGCKNCYAETLVTGRMGLPLWGDKADRKIAAESTWKEPLRWNRLAKQAGERHRVFCASLADVFEPRTDLAAPRARLARLIEATPHLDWLLLTKRPESMAQLAREEMGWPGAWPDNVWAGTTVEHQAAAAERIPHLLRVPARVRFLSCEPMLEEVNLTGDFGGNDYLGDAYDDDAEESGISWVIVGGESGHRARLFDLAWARSIRNQCRAAGVPFFMKQLGANAWHGPPELRAQFRTKHPAGADPEEWCGSAENLRVQEFPR